MTRLTRRTVLIGAASLPFASPLAASPVTYQLDPEASQVRFQFAISGIAQQGTMPVSQASIRVDPRNLGQSTADVSLDVARASTRFSYARDAMLGADVLDVRRFPTIRFVSTSVRLGSGGRLSDGAVIRGNLTIRDVTRPVEFQANLFRQPGSAPDDLDELRFDVKGTISRAAFGATGYRDLVRDPVTLDIRVVIRASG